MAPSTELRKWFHHDPAQWPEFKRKYVKELQAKEELLRKLCTDANNGVVTLLYSAKDEVHNQAVVLGEYLENMQ